VRELLDIGEDVRLVNNQQEVLFLCDKTESVSSINPVTEDLVLNDQLVAYWTDDPTYAAYLFSFLKQRGQSQFQLLIEYKSYLKKLISYPKTVLRQLAE
jgi:hypothetical protein